MLFWGFILFFVLFLEKVGAVPPPPVPATMKIEVWVGVSRSLNVYVVTAVTFRTFDSQ